MRLTVFMQTSCQKVGARSVEETRRRDTIVASTPPPPFTQKVIKGVQHFAEILISIFVQSHASVTF